MTDAVKRIADDFAASAPGTSFAAVSFGYSAEVVSNLTSDVSKFKNTIENNAHTQDYIEHIGAALRLCENILPSAPASRVVLVFADGQDGRRQGLEASRELKENNVTIGTIAIGGGADIELLKQIASSEQLFTAVEDFDALTDSIRTIVDSVCLELPLIERMVVVIPLTLSLISVSIAIAAVAPAILVSLPVSFNLQTRFRRPVRKIKLKGKRKY